MRVIKYLDIYVLKNFLTLFAGTFCISLFVVMMQFLWKYVDELVGKGLPIDILAKFFGYAALTLVPLALPLAILLASLISFGNMGERLELLSIKAAGVSLFRTLRPLAILMVIFAGISFYFQDVIAPKANTKVLQLRMSIAMTSPELDIPEGVFYDGIDNVNLYVKHKNKDTGMLYDVIIYNLRDGLDNAHIILADSADLETSADEKYLVLSLYSGNQYESMPSTALRTQFVPYRRETFLRKQLLIDFDTSFQNADSADVSTSALTKNIQGLMHDIDSINSHIDSIGLSNYNDMRRNVLSVRGREDVQQRVLIDNGVGKKIVREENNEVLFVRADKSDNNNSQGKTKGDGQSEKTKVDIDSVFHKMESTDKENVVRAAVQAIQRQQSELEFRSSYIKDEQKTVRRYEGQIWNEITMALACIVFFFIGAPLGAIIRKGGLGLPVVVSVVIFILYYIINTGGTKMSREGTVPVWLGLWASTIVLAPLGVFFTVKSNNDSVVFNMDTYRNFFIRLLGIPQHRHIVRKEVIIDDPDYEAIVPRLNVLAEECRNYRKSHPRLFQWQLMLLVVKNEEDKKLKYIHEELEAIVDELSNSKDRQLLLYLNEFPILRTSPRLRNRLRKELRTVYKTCEKITNHISEI